MSSPVSTPAVVVVGGTTAALTCEQQVALLWKEVCCLKKRLDAQATQIQELKVYCEDNCCLSSVPLEGAAPQSSFFGD